MSAASLVRLVLISVPPEPLASRLDQLRSQLATLSSSKASLRYPVHLTLRTGALVPEDRLKDFFRVFGDWVGEIPCVPIRLGNFITTHLPVGAQQGAGGCFAGFAVDASPELLAVHQALAAFELFRKGQQYSFHPHVTMAFDDLDDTGLGRIEAFMRGRESEFAGASWNCQRVECYRLSGERWVEQAALPLKSEPHHG